MALAETYSRLRGSVVAFIPKVFPAARGGGAPEIPPIFGTGFVLHKDGIIVTNHHVVEAFKRYRNPPGIKKESWPVYAMLFHRIDEGIVEIPLEVFGVAVIKSFEPGEVYYGPPKPDLAIVHVKARGLPAVTVDEKTEIREGMTVATAGFPMGSDLLTAPGWLHQISPTLQQGIVSAVQPFAMPHPHSFSLNIMIQGGASGSPVFMPEAGAVVGIMYASLGEPSLVWRITDDGKKERIGFVRLPTAISHAVPGHYLMHFLNDLGNHPEFLPPEDALTIEEMIAKAKLVSRFSGDQVFRPIYGDDGESQLAVRHTHTDN
jgi:S1-C subfamily serine protease